MGKGAEEIRYPREKNPIGQAIFWCVILAMSAGMLALGWYGLSSPDWAVGICIVAFVTISLIVVVREASRFTLRTYRGRRASWWIRASGNGFEINDRLLGPRRFEWQDIECVAVARFPQEYDDGTTKIIEQVGLRYRPDHPRLNSRRRRSKGVDVVIEGPWDRSPDDAVALLNSWRTPGGVPEQPILPIPDTSCATTLSLSEIPYPRDGRTSEWGICGLLIVGGAGLVALGNFVMSLTPAGGGGVGGSIAFIGMFALALSVRAAYVAAVRTRCMTRARWWIRRSDNGFEINDRWPEPRGFDWGDIEDVVVAKISVEDVGKVGIRYVPNNLGFNPRARHKKGVDLVIDGPWDRPPTQAVELLRTWRSESRASS